MEIHSLNEKTDMVNPVKRKGMRHTEMDSVLGHSIEEWFVRLGNSHYAVWGNIALQ